jgi:hypothetical protein
MNPRIWTPEIIRPYPDGARARDFLRREREKDRHRWRHVRDPRFDDVAERQAAFSIVQIPTTPGQVGAATTVSKAFTSNPTLGNLVVAILLYIDDADTTVNTLAIKDANNNSFTITPNSPSNARPLTAGLIYMGYILSAPSNADKTITATFANAGIVASLWVMEFSPNGGTASFSSDITGTGTTGTALNTPTVSTAGTDTLMIAAALSDHQVSTVDSPWTQVAAGVANQFSEGIGYILSRASNAALAMTQNQSSGWDSMGAAFALTPGATDTGLKFRKTSRPAPFKPMGDAFRTGKYRGWR